MWLRFFNTETRLWWGLNVFTSTTELSGVRHTDSWASTAGEEMRARLGLTKGDNMKLGLDEGSGVWETGGSALQGERGRWTWTASAGVPCSSTTEMEGSECKCVGMLTSETFSDWHSGLPLGWLSSESTSLTGEKQRETFTASFLFWDDWGVPRWDFGACTGVWLRVRQTWAGVRRGWAGEAVAWTGVCANARDRRVTLLGER